MARAGRRLNITLDDEYATKLGRLAERAHVQEVMLARSLLSHAIDEADVDPDNVVQILEGISGSFDRAQLGVVQARSGDATRLDDL
jgi:hypothetical protein